MGRDRDQVASVHAAIAAMGVGGFLAALGLKARLCGQKARICCPTHGGKDPNACVEIKNGRLVFACFSGCGGAGGDALHLVAAVEGLDLRQNFARILSRAAAAAGMAPVAHGEAPAARLEPKEAPQAARARIEAAQGLQRVLGALLEICPLEGEGLRYLTEDRGLSAATCRAARVGYIADPERVCRTLLAGFPAEVLDELGIVYRGEHLAFKRHPLLFPIIRAGRPVYVQGRALGVVEQKQDRWRSMRGSVPWPYNVDALGSDWRRDVLIAEGPIDTLSAVDLGTRRAVIGVFGAGGFKRAWAIDLRGRNVLLALDPDAAGENGCDRIVAHLHAVGARVERMDLDQLDINEMLIAERAS